MALVSMTGVAKAYEAGAGPVSVLRGVDLEIRRGEYVALTGCSGSGKTTLMNIMGLLDVASGGSYRFDGIDVSNGDDGRLSRLRNERIGFVFQSFNLVPKLTVRENVLLPITYSRADARAAARRADELLDAVGLAERAAFYPSALSGGQQQRAAVARALLRDPDLLLADEPTGNLDSQSSDEVLSLFDQLNGKGRTIILVTHDAEVARRAARQARLEDGRVTAISCERCGGK